MSHEGMHGPSRSEIKLMRLRFLGQSRNIMVSEDQFHLQRNTGSRSCTAIDSGTYLVLFAVTISNSVRIGVSDLYVQGKGMHTKLTM